MLFFPDQRRIESFGISTKLWDPINVQYTNSLTPKVIFLLFVLVFLGDGGDIGGMVDTENTCVRLWGDFESPLGNGNLHPLGCDALERIN